MAKKTNKDDDGNKKTPLTIENGVAQDTLTASRPVFLWFAVVTLLIFGTGLYWLVEQQKIAVASMASRIEAGELQFDEELGQLNQMVATESVSTAKLLENLSSTNAALSKKITEIVKIQGMTDNDVKRVWAMAEVEFLLQTANQRVLLVRDTEGAKIILGLADEKLKELADPKLYYLRSLLSDDQLALASVTKVDIDGFAVRLQSILNQVDSLQVLMAPVTSREEVESQESSKPENWGEAMAAAWNSVRSLVTIRHQEDGAAAVLAPKERYFLYQNLHLKLETARTALLGGQEETYHDSLTSAEHWLGQYFIGEGRDAVMSSVRELNTVKITVVIPDISASLAWLQKNGEQR